jgi:hypothetical protein
VNSVLSDLADEVLALADSPEHLGRRRLWRSLHELNPPRALVSYAMYAHVWEREIAGSASFVHADGLERAIEVQLRARLWKARHIHDDEPVLPTVWLGMPHPPGGARLWGVALCSERSSLLGAYKPVPPIEGECEIARIRSPRYEEDREEGERLVREATELVGGKLPIKLHTDELHFGPFEWVVRMRGMDNLLFDVVDRPDMVHELMGFVTDGMVSYHMERELAGAVDAEASWGFHMYWDHPDDGPGMPAASDRLRDCWAYVHAQSAVSLSPRMYEEFVQPYNERIATLFGRIYYHGCEDLSRKCRTIGRLPNLRLFHVGPWTPVEPVVECLGRSVALEVHSHPTNVLFAWTPEQVRADLAARHAAAGDVPHVLKLCDVETIGAGPDRIRAWVQSAREVAEC